MGEWVVSVWSFPTEERAQQNHTSHSHARQEPAVEAFLALPALGCCIVPVESHKSVLQGDRREGNCLSSQTGTWLGQRGWSACDDLAEVKNCSRPCPLWGR